MQFGIIRAILYSVLMYRERCTTAGGWLHHPKGGEAMPITFTFHVLTYTITITVKQNRRHSAK